MVRYRKILVAFDGSGSSKNALRQAIKLARKEGSWIKVVSVVPSYEGELELTGVQNLESAIKGPAERLLEEARGIAKSEDAAILTNVEQGEAYERIVDVAESENCDLIVMGRKGHGHIERALIGCVTERVIGHTQKDVLVVPKDTEIGFGSILLATDGSKYSEAATERAMEFAKSYGSELIAGSVVDVNEEFQANAPAAVERLVRKAKEVLEGVRAKADASGVKALTLVKEGEAYKAITDIAREKGAKVIIMGSHGRKGLGRLLMGSVTQKVIGHAPCPVLVVRA